MRRNHQPIRHTVIRAAVLVETDDGRGILVEFPPGAKFNLISGFEMADLRLPDPATLHPATLQHVDLIGYGKATYVWNFDDLFGNMRPAARDSRELNP